jgi:hypothetical protein
LWSFLLWSSVLVSTISDLSHSLEAFFTGTTIWSSNF